MKRLSVGLAALLYLLLGAQGTEYVYGSQGEKYYTVVESQVKDAEIIKFLRARGVKIETDTNGLLRLYLRETPGAIPALVKFLGLMKTWSEVTMGNIANIDTVWDGASKAPYRRKQFSIDKDGNASVVIDEKTPPIIRYLPGHPYADAEGYVSFPAISLGFELIQLGNASWEYHLAESLLQRCLPGNYISVSTIDALKQSVEQFRGMEELRSRLDRIERKLDALAPAR